MLGLLLTGAATLFEEASSSLGKKKVAQHKEGPYTLGFLTYLGAFVVMLILTFAVPQHHFLPGFPDGFRFDPASLPTFILKTLLELVLSVAATFAVIRADRSTFGFLRTATLPLLLMVDLVLGYSVSVVQILGIALITVSLLFLFINHGLSRRGSLLTLTAAVLAVATISLYKYNIEHFNSVGAEMTLSLAMLVLYFYVLARRAGEKPLSVRRCYAAAPPPSCSNGRNTTQNPAQATLRGVFAGVE